MKRCFLYSLLAILVLFLINGVANSGEIIGTWSNGIWYWDVAASEWTKMTASVPSGDITAGDFTGDGKADVASCWDNGLWYQDGDTFDWKKVSNSAPSQVAAGDVTGDGRAEIIGTWSNGIWYWDVTASNWTQMTASTPTGDIAAGDFTCDGKADVASCWSNGLWYQDGDTLKWTKVSNKAPTKLTAGDVTGDGCDEIIGTLNNGIWYYDVATSKWIEMTASIPTGEIAAKDFTGDGKADVASCWSNGLWYQDGDTLKWTKVSNTAPTQLTAGVTTTAPITDSVVVYATGSNLYSTDLIGSSVINLNRRLKSRLIYIFGYKISPDKRFVTYWGDIDYDGQEDLDIVPILGGRVAKIIDIRKRILDYHWAPNSKRILYQIHDSPPSEFGGLYTVKADGTDYQIIMEHDYSDKLDIYLNTRNDNWSSDSKRIAFKLYDEIDKDEVLYSVLPDGTGKVRLSEDLPNARILPFQWSPDGSRIYYLFSDSLSRKLFTVNANGTGRVRITEGGLSHSVDPQWSPDGSHIAFVNWINRSDELFISLADTAQLVKVSGNFSDRSEIWHFQFSPNGKQIAYIISDPGIKTEELVIVNTDGTESKIISGDYGRDFKPHTFKWSPDGSRLAYTLTDRSRDDGVWDELYTIKHDKTGVVKISGDLAERTGVSEYYWSPDGSRIAYVAIERGFLDLTIYTSLPNGNDKVAIELPHQIAESDPSFKWSLDSTRLLLLLYSDYPIKELFSVLADGSNSALKINAPLGSWGIGEKEVRSFKLH